MGQQWLMVNLDKRQHLGKRWGTLEQFLFSGTTPSLATTMILHSSTKTYQYEHDSWAGDRIMCVGGGADEYPPFLLTDDEKKELKNWKGHLYKLAANEYNEIRPEGFSPKYGQNLVLRNHTRRLYVRQDKLPKTRYGIVDPPTLAEVLIVRTCWSSWNWKSLRYGDITRGVWAGDRFDVATLELVEEAKQRGFDWRDVSEEVAKEIGEIWKCEFGS